MRTANGLKPSLLLSLIAAAALSACGDQKAASPKTPTVSAPQASTQTNSATAAAAGAAKSSAASKKQVDITKRKLTIYNKKLDTLNGQLAAKEDQRLQLIQATSGIDQQNVYIAATKEGLLGNSLAAGGAIAGGFVASSSGSGGSGGSSGNSGSSNNYDPNYNYATDTSSNGSTTSSGGSNTALTQAFTTAGAALGKGVNGEINAAKAKNSIGRILGDAQEQLNLVIAQIGSLKSEIRELENLILELTDET